MGEAMKRNTFANFAWIVTGYNILVILWGAYVRATGSGAGCGSHWPMCNGAIVPRAPQVETIIEYVHRLTSGLALLLVIAMVIWAFRRYPAGHMVRKGAVVSIVFIIIEALVGAGLVRFEWVADDASVERVVVIAIHLVNTFVLLAALSLTAWWASGGERVDLRGHGSSVWWFSAALLGVVVIGITGAITALGDTLFPAGSLAEGIAQDFDPMAHFLVRLRVWHPVAAVLIGLYVGFLSGIIFLFRATPHVRRIALILLALFVIQLAAGMVNLLLLAPVWMQIVHLLLADLVWVALVLLTAANFGESELRQSLLEPVKATDLKPTARDAGANFSQRAPKP
jgi:heme A synthase